MKKGILVIGMFLCIAAFAVAGDFEIGVGFSPPLGNGGEEGAPEEETTISFHFGYSFWWLFYAAWDSYVMPPGAMSELTGYIEEGAGGETYFVDGYYRPGFVNMFNVGFRPRIGPLTALATVGVNQLYIYKQDDAIEGIDYDPEAGANLRLGLGFRSKSHWMIMASAVSIFASMDELTGTLSDLNSSDPWISQQAEDRIVESLYPTITLNIWF